MYVSLGECVYVCAYVSALTLETNTLPAVCCESNTCPT